MIYALVVGVWLGALQVALFFALVTNLSSAFVSYAALLFFWLVGSAAGVWIRRPLSGLLILVSGTAPYALMGLLQWQPYSLTWLPAHGVLIGASALFAGHFFQAERTRFDRFGRLLAWETLGFCIGLGASVVAVLTLGGVTFLRLAPGAGMVVVGLARAVSGRAGRGLVRGRAGDPLDGD